MTQPAGVALLGNGVEVDINSLPFSDDSINHMGSTMDKGPNITEDEHQALLATFSGGLLGVDVSGYNPGINFRVLASAGRKYVIVKCVEGTTFRSAAWFSWGYPSAIVSAGLHLGSYAFVHTGSAVDQARVLIAAKGAPASTHMRDWIDIEGSEWNSANSVPFVRAYIAEYRRLTGIAPGVYCSSSFFFNELHGGAGWLASDIPLWIAHYGVVAGNPGVGNWDIHQYAVGTAPGAGGNIDLNISNGMDMSKTMAGKGGYTPPSSDTGDSQMGATLLPDGSVVLVTVGLDAYPYISFDEGASWKLLSKSYSYAGGVELAYYKNELLAVVRDNAHRAINLIHIDPVTLSTRVQGIGGTGAGTPSITVKPNGDLFFSVKGTDTRGTIYTKTIHPDGTVKDWAPSKGAAKVAE